MIRWQPLPSLWIRLRRADPTDVAINAVAAAVFLLAALAIAGAAFGAARASLH